MTVVRGARTAPGGDFTEALAKLKQEGANTLIVGDLAPTVRDNLARRQFGSFDEERIRVLGVVGEADVQERFPHEWAAEARTPSTRLIRHREFDRGTSGTGSASATSPRSPAQHRHQGQPGGHEDRDAKAINPQLGAFQDRLLGTIGAFKTQQDGFEPSQLRVGIHDLAILAQAYGRTDVISFVERCCEVIRQHAGMGHLCCAAARSASAIKELERFVEIVIDVRSLGKDWIQTWDLRSYDIQESFQLKLDQDY